MTMAVWRYLRRRTRKRIVLDTSAPDSDFERWMVAWLHRAVHGGDAK